MTTPSLDKLAKEAKAVLDKLRRKEEITFDELRILNQYNKLTKPTPKKPKK